MARRAASRAERAAASWPVWLTEQIESDKKESDHTVQRSARCFDRARAASSASFCSVYRTHIDDEKQSSRRQFGVIMAQLLAIRSRRSPTA